MNAPPFPLNPEIGQWFGNWIWNGARWVAIPTQGLRVVVQTFLQSGPYMPTPGLVSLTVECIGGGGCGGGAGPPPEGNIILCGGGGGSGGYSRATLPAALVRGGVLVTVGDGGVPASPGPYNGGSTSFGVLCIANGGRGAGWNDAVSSAGGFGEMAPPGVGDVAFPGTNGFNGPTQVVPAGTVTLISAVGGLGGWGIGGGSQNYNTGEQSHHPGLGGAPNTGAGGSGAVLNQIGDPAVTEPGGAGGSGICIVTEYCWGMGEPEASIRPPRPPWPMPPWPGQPWPPGWGPWGPPPGPWPPGPWPRGEGQDPGADQFGPYQAPEDDS